MSTAVAEPAIATSAVEPTVVHKPFEPPALRPGEIVWWSQSPVEDGGEAVAIVASVGLRAISVFIFPKGGGLMPYSRDGVFHRDDPRAKHLDVSYSSGVWWKMQTDPDQSIVIESIRRHLDQAEKRMAELTARIRTLEAEMTPDRLEDERPKKQTVRPAMPS